VNCRSFVYCAVVLLLISLPLENLRAQGVCDAGNGSLNPALPQAITPGGIILEFSRKEAKFKAARDRYGFTLNITVQTLDNNDRVDGQYQQVSEYVLNDDGKRVEKTTFAPQSTLWKLTLSEDDLDDMRQRIPFPLTPDELPHFSITYVGRQRVDQLNTYVFDVGPKDTKKDTKVFEGCIWVDDLDLMIVKTCGKPREDQNANFAKKNQMVSLTPVFVTYREQIDDQFWFPTYSRADELLRFPRGFIHVREVVKYTDYKLLPKK
jgi:hypothetical protein